MRQCAGGILLKDKRILLGKRADDLDFYPNTWDIIGGHCEIDEEPEDTLIRELKEELDITPKVFKKTALLSEPQPQIYGEGECHVYVVTEWIGKEPTALGSEHSEIRWFLLEEAMELDLAHPQYVDLFREIQRKHDQRNTA